MKKIFSFLCVIIIGVKVSAQAPAAASQTNTQVLPAQSITKTGQQEQAVNIPNPVPFPQINGTNASLASDRANAVKSTKAVSPATKQTQLQAMQVQQQKPVQKDSSLYVPQPPQH